MAKPVKWGIGTEEPDDSEFRSNDEIGKPPKGVYNFRIVRLEKKSTQNGDPRISIVAEIHETAKDKKKWNGYTVWDGVNFIEGPSLRFVKMFAKAIGATWNDIVNKTQMDDTEPNPLITRIGPVNFAGKKPIMARATTKDDNYNGEDRLVIGSWLAPKEEDDEVGEPEDIDGEEVDEEIEEVEEEETESEDEGDEEPWTREELEEITSLKELKEEAVAVGVSADEIKTIRKKSTIIDLILAAQDGDEEEDEEDEEDEEEDEELDLDSLDTDELKKLAKEKGASIREIKRAKTDKALRALIEELLEDDDDDEDGEEPPF